MYVCLTKKGTKEKALFVDKMFNVCYILCIIRCHFQCKLHVMLLNQFPWTLLFEKRKIGGISMRMLLRGLSPLILNTVVLSLASATCYFCASEFCGSGTYTTTCGLTTFLKDLKPKERLREFV